ncbi:18.2 kDa class I heat shock protein-like [Juglans microcarpa x Juglans regia]|uniref:18.2 kDa class I heat shock protein-like n=1 Tax=Juglans microcarpa x Juglans regia TaxID=2249226 RepID=UPI001B7E5D41|nr:18.2 kDa class I heat shock protein-like [Juglans microcarpa x Juglans regia]
MSIVPFTGRESNVSDSNSSRDLWDPFRNFHENGLWDPFSDFPLPSSLLGFRPLSPFGTSVNTSLDWRETQTAHVLNASLPGFMDEDVLIELQDDRVLQVSVESGRFMSRFKIPDDAKLEQLKASMHNGCLTVTVPKVEARRPNVRTIDIFGSG